MKVQINTDKTINGDQKSSDYFASFISEKLSKFESHITRIEVHLSDENGKKEGVNDIKCLLEARIEGKPPIAVSANSDKIEAAVAGAVEKIKASIQSILGRSAQH